jgi:hypothetical protein
MATYKVLTGTKRNGDPTTYLVSEDLEIDAKDNGGMSLVDYVKKPGEILTEKGTVEITGKEANFLPEIMIEA